MSVLNKINVLRRQVSVNQYCHKEISSKYAGEKVNEGVSFGHGKCIEENMYDQNDDDDDYWNRGPITARYCGTMLWDLHSGVGLEMTINKSFRLVNYSSNTVCAVSGDGESCAIIHKTGVVYAQKDCVEIRGFDPIKGNDKYAKMTGNKIIFSSQKSGVVYVFDNSGVVTKTGDTMTNLHQDISLTVFLRNCKCGQQYKQDAVEIIGESYYKLNKDRTQKWLVNGVSISFTESGVLTISRGKGEIRVSTNLNGTARISTPHVNLTALGGSDPHLAVRKDSLKVLYDGQRFVNINGKQAAGFDKDGLFTFFD